MTLLWCIAILAPSFFLLKCWLAALGIVNIRTNLEEVISPCWRPERTWMSTAKIRNQHPTGTRVSESLPRAAFSYRSSSPGSLTRGQARSESTPFNRESHSQWPQRWVTFLWRCQYKSGQKIWPKPSKTAWNPAMWRAPTRTMPRITKSSSSGIFPHGNFSTVVRQTELNKIVAFNNSPTRWTVSAPGWRTWSGPKALDEGGATSW